MGVRESLHQEIQTLSIELRREDADAGYAAAGMRERTHQPGSHHIVGNSQDGNCPSGSLRGTYRGIARAQDYIGTRRHQFIREFGKVVLFDPEATRIDDQVLAFEYSELAQFIKESYEIRLLPSTAAQNR
jgi:hypothetical protein